MLRRFRKAAEKLARARRARPDPLAERFRIEPLEPRILLSADPMLAPIALLAEDERSDDADEQRDGDADAERRVQSAYRINPESEAESDPVDNAERGDLDLRIEDLSDGSDPVALADDDPAVRLDNGQQLAGEGAAAVSVTNAGLVSPGNSPGIMAFDAYTQEESGTLLIEVGGTDPGTEHDQLQVSGAASLAGTLDLAFIDDFQPAVGQSFTLLTADSVDGAFSEVRGLHDQVVDETYLRLDARDTSLVLEALSAQVLAFDAPQTSGETLTLDLSQSAAGTLTLSGAETQTIDLADAAALVLDASSAHQIRFNADIDLGETHLLVRAGQIALSEGAWLRGAGDVVLFAHDHADAAARELTELQAGITINGRVDAGATLALHASTSAAIMDVRELPSLPLQSRDTALSSTIEIGDAAVLSGANVRINAVTDGNVQIGHASAYWGLTELRSSETARVTIGAASITATDGRGGLTVLARTDGAYQASGVLTQQTLSADATVRVQGATLVADDAALRLLARQTLDATALGPTAGAAEAPVNSAWSGAAMALNLLAADAEVHVTDSVLRAGDIRLLADHAAQLTATVAGVAGGDGDLPGLPDALPALAANALLAGNSLTGETRVRVVDSTLVSAGDARLDARQLAQLAATLDGGADTDGTAAVAALAFNTLGWRPDAVLSQGAGALLQRPGETDLRTLPTALDVLNSRFAVGGDLRLAAVSAPQLQASVNTDAATEGDALAFGLVQAMNLGAADTTLTLSGVWLDAEPIGGALVLLAADAARIEARVALSVASGGGAALSGMLARNDLRHRVDLRLEDVQLEAVGNVHVLARSTAGIDAEVRGVQPAPDGADGEAGADAQPGFGLSAVAAVNQLTGRVNVELIETRLQAGADLVVDARLAASLSAENSAEARGGAGALGAVLALNTLGWEAPALLTGAIGAVLGGDPGDEQPLLARVLVRDSVLAAEGDLRVQASTQQALSAVLDVASETPSAQAAAGLLIAGNLASTRARVQLERADQTTTSAFAASPPVLLSAGATLTLAATDTARVDAGVSLQTGAGGAVAASGAVVRNALTSAADVTIDAVRLVAGEALVVAARADAAIDAALAGRVELDGSEESAGSGLALNGLIAVNQVHDAARVTLTDSWLASDGDVRISALREGRVRAELQASASADGAAVGLSLALNSVGVAAGDLLSGSVDALLGTTLGSSDPARALVRIEGGRIDADGDLQIRAGADDASDPSSRIEALISDETTGGVGVGLLLAGNQIETDTRVELVRHVATNALLLRSGGEVRIDASERAAIDARVSLTAEGGLAVGAVVVRNAIDASVRTLVDGVDLQAEGDARLDAVQQSTVHAELVGLVAAQDAGSGASGLAASGAIASNHVLGGAEARLSNSRLDVTGDLVVHAQTAGEIAAVNAMTLDAAGSAAGALLAFNTVGWRGQTLLTQGVDVLLGTEFGERSPLQALAQITGGDITVAGDLHITVTLSSSIRAELSSRAATSNSGVAAGLVLASNRIANTADAALLDHAAQLSVAGQLRVNADDAPRIVAEGTVEARAGQSDEDDGAQTLDGTLGQLLTFLSGDMPQVERELLLATLPVGGESHSLAARFGLGWEALSVLGFLDGKGVQPPAAAVDGTSLGLQLGEVAGRALPAATLELLLPDPELPTLQQRERLGSVEFAGETIDWGLDITVDWSVETVAAWLQALNSGAVADALPQVRFDIYLDGDTPETLAAVPFLPPAIALVAPAVELTVLGQPLRLLLGTDTASNSLTLDLQQQLAGTPLARLIDAELDTRQVALPTIDLDRLAVERRTPELLLEWEAARSAAREAGDLPEPLEVDINTLIGVSGEAVRDALIDAVFEAVAFLPEQLTLRDPTLSLSLLGTRFEQPLPFAATAAALAGVDWLSADTDDDGSFAAVDLRLLATDLLPSAWHGIADRLFVAERAVDAAVPDIAFGDLTPAALDDYRGVLDQALALLAEFGVNLPFTAIAEGNDDPAPDQPAVEQVAAARPALGDDAPAQPARWSFARPEFERFVLAFTVSVNHSRCANERYPRSARPR